MSGKKAPKRRRVSQHRCPCILCSTPEKDRDREALRRKHGRENLVWVATDGPPQVGQLVGMVSDDPKIEADALRQLDEWDEEIGGSFHVDLVPVTQFRRTWQGTP